VLVKALGGLLAFLLMEQHIDKSFAIRGIRMERKDQVVYLTSLTL